MKRLAPLAAVLALATSAFAAFNSPTAVERTAALGDLSTVPPILRVLLTPDDDYNLITMPQRGDWLTEHTEHGQSFAEFLAAEPNLPQPPRRIIYFLPIGKFYAGSSPSLETLRRYATAFFQMEVKILPAYKLSDLEFEPRINRQSQQVQIWTYSVRQFLATRLPADGYCLLGITMRDLYPRPSWNFVFGEATLQKRVGIYSFARFDPDFFGEERPENFNNLLLLRSCKVLTHEAGHMFGMEHCIYYDCVMNGSNHLAEADLRTVRLCPVCLRKLQHSTGFDPIKRYRELRRFYRQQSWTAEAEWCEQQLAKAKSVAP